MNESDYVSLIIYYGREKFYNSMHQLALEAIAKHSANVFHLLNGISLILGNRVQEGIRELNPITSDRDVGIGAILATISAQKKCTVVDKQQILELEHKIKEERKKISANSAYYAALFLYLSGKTEKARDYSDKALRMNNEHCEALALKGFCDLVINPTISKSTLELFEKSLYIKPNIDATLGLVKYHQINNDFENAISILNKFSVRYPQINIPLVEKMKTLLASWDFEQAQETSYRILNLEPTNIEALRIKAIVLLCRDGNVEETIECLQTLYKALEKVEPSNSEIYYEIAQLFSKCSGRNPKILMETFKFAEKATVLSPANANYLTELGFQSVLLKQLKNAVKYFRNATKVDDSSVYALCGLTLCQLIESGPSVHVSQQIEFLTEIQGTNKIPLLIFLSAKLLTDQPKEAIASLIEACEIHFRNLKTLAYGAEYLKVFDPDFLLQLCKELLQYCPIQQSISVSSSMSRENLHISLKHSLNILEAIVKAVPGSVDALYHLAKVQFLSGEVASSALSLQKILQEIDPTCSAAHLLIAQIHIQQKSWSRASQSLEICLSHDFHVRDNPLYHLVSGIVQKSQQKYDECLKNFLTAINLCGYNHIVSGGTSNSSLEKLTKQKSESEENTLGLADQVTLFLEIINTYTLMNENTEANKLMQAAMNEFSKTPEAGRIIIVNADLFLNQGNIVRALELLSDINPGQSYYVQAKTKMANIYLVHKKDRVSFAQCFKEIVQNSPGADSYLLLGDAYLGIQGLI